MKPTNENASLKDELTSSIKPGDDFYNFVNKKWADNHPIPADKARYGAFDVLNDENLAKLKKLLEADAETAEHMTVRLAKQYYRAAMDELAIAKVAPKFVQNLISEITALSDSAAVGTYLTEQHAKGRSFIWDVIIEPDDKDSRRYFARFWQGGLGMPERTYYLEDSDKFIDIRKKYRTYLVDLFKLAGLDKPEERSEHVYGIEEALAKASMTMVDCRDPHLIYNLFTAQKLQTDYPSLTWKEYLSKVGLGGVQNVNVSQPGFMTEVNRLLNERPIEHWQDYFIIRNLSWLADKLSPAYEQLVFNFYGKVLSGKEIMEPRHRRITRSCMDILPEPTGRLFVEHFFDETAKAAISDLVDYLKVALGERIKQLEWMSDATKKEALHKLSTFLPLLGYPDKWRTYNGLELTGNYVDNYLAIYQFDWKFQVGRINQPVDREEWHMSPALVNAYYWPNTNGITFPAGILQPPFFDAKGDFAANYGGIGGVIGHELTHGFDDQGAKFDADGNMKGWWQESDQANFDARTKQLVEQYNGYEIAGRHLDGELTLGENIADLGGLLVAYDAMQNLIKASGKNEEIDGLSPEQRFFIGFARVESANIRDELAIHYIVTDPHSPSFYRVNGVLPNMDAFYEAFDISPQDKLYIAPDKRVRIW